MRVGLNVANFAPPPGHGALGTELARVARRADDLGFDSFWVWDHFFWDESPVGPGVTDRPMIEAYTTLGFIAGVTSAIKLGTMVASVTYRHPGALVKEVTTLDVLSGGRAIFGAGAGWFEEEHRALGIPFPGTAERFERLEETVRIALQMWGDEGKYDRAAPFHGRHYRLERTLNVPQAVQRPHPPILIGGSGERKTLRLVARYADACNINGRLPAEQLAHKLDVLRGHCAEAGRPYDAIEKTVYARVRIGEDGAVAASDILAYCRAMAALGFDTLIAAVDSPGIYRPGALDVWGRELLPAIHRLPVAGR
ncbi:MAG TPA: LLM class F420-dependent oxidoreductase [bacterium]|nr:LLM class F420-dependent oxidoreductase [bacterium]